MEQTDPPLLTQTRGQVAVLTLNRPARLNAIGRDVLALLAAAVAEAAADERVRALVIAGAGRAFCAGADLSEIEALPDARAFRGFIAGLAARVAAGAPLALATGKRLVDRGLGMDLAAAISYEGESVGLLFGTADRVAGLEAFRERRPPAFTGH